MEKKNEEFSVDPITCVEEVFEVGKVNGIVYQMVNIMKEKSHTEQLLLYSAFLEFLEEIDNG